jgi:DNA-binding transcriptional LysR family regulator
MHICRILFSFQWLNPKIAVDLNLTDEKVDLIREGVDIAIRLGPLKRQFDENSGARNVQAATCGLARISRNRRAP